MNVKKRVVTTICAGALAGAALGIGSGVASAGPKIPGPPPWPVPGPGVNVGGPGNPLPPGQNGLPPPGHRNVRRARLGAAGTAAAVLGAVASSGMEQ